VLTMLRVHLWGTRGSVAVSGQDVVRHGGNTSCVVVTGYDEAVPGGAELPGNPRVVLDAGSGILSLQEVIMTGECGRGEGDLHVLLSHYHWDHVCGLPTFNPLFISGNRVSLYGRSREEVESTIETLFTSAYSPMKGARNLAAEVTVHALAREGMDIAGLHVRALSTNHPGGALAFRVSYGEHSVVYSPDHETGAPEFDGRLVEFAREADLWIADATYSKDDIKTKTGWGHSSHLQATSLGLKAGVKRLLLFHHCPDYSDEQLESMESEAARLAAGRGLEVLSGRDGMVVTVL